MGLGVVDTVPPGEARAKAAELKTFASKGIDPIEQRRKIHAAAAAKQAEQKAEADKGSHTFAAVAEEYIDMKSSEWANAKHAQQWRNTLDTYAAPIMGDLPVADITSEHIWQILTPIWTTKTETATRVRSRIELVIDYAIGRGWRAGENPARWRGRLKSTMATPSRIKNVRHHPALPRERDVVEAAVSEATFRQVAQKMQKTLDIKLTGDPVKAVEVLANRYTLNESERAGVLRHLIVEGDLSAYGLVNAVTHCSDDVENYDRATEFEALGGKLIELSSSEWKEVAEAA